MNYAKIGKFIKGDEGHRGLFRTNKGIKVNSDI